MQDYELLEKRFGEWCGNPNVVACSSGTAALHLALESLRLPLGSRVIVPEFTMIACARAVTLAGHRVVSVDCNDRLLLDTDLLLPLSHSSIQAIMPVHIYGRRCDMGQIHQWAQPLGIKVIEDMAEAHGIPIHPLTDAACYSFYKNKIIHGEEGGAIVFRHAEDAEYARCLRSLGFTYQHDFRHIPRGHNYRLANCLARLILDSLERVDIELARRRQIEQLYDSLVPADWRMPSRDVIWVYDLRIPGMRKQEQDAIVASLQASGVSVRHGFVPISRQIEYRGPYLALRAFRLSQEIIYLPCDSNLSESEIERFMGILSATVARARFGASLPS